MTRVPGVKKVDVSFEKKLATVTAEKGKVKPEQLVAELEKSTVFKGKIQ